MTIVCRPWSLLLCAELVGGCHHAAAQTSAPATPVSPAAAGLLPPGGYGSLTQSDISLRLRTGDLDVRFVPLDARVTRLLARDSYESLRSLVASHRAQLDSVARISGTSRPGLAFVSFFAQSANARFDPQTLTVVVRSRELRPVGIVPFSGRFTAQQLNVREQVSAIYLYSEDLPVNDSFTIKYGGETSDDWVSKQTTLDRERARVASRQRDSAGDSTSYGAGPDSTLGH
jgi:hypothetical protein